MSLDPNMMFSSFRVIGDIPTRSLIGRRRGVIGTGFFVTARSEADEAVRYGYAVTAHHVVSEQPTVEIQAPNPSSSGESYEPVRVDGWRQPLEGVDLAVASFTPAVDDPRSYQGLEMERQVLPYDRFPALGADIYYIGYFAPLDRPMARSGTIGALDQEGIRHEDDYDYAAHLVDCRSYAGFSGSPVFLETRYAGLTPTNPTLPLPPDWQPRPMADIYYFAVLCGMFTSHVESLAADEPASRYGVGVMLRSREIWDALNSKELRDERRSSDERRRSRGD